MYKAMIKKSKNKKGFTLVELIVVMAILAILSAILIPSVSGMIRRSNRAVDNANARNLYMAGSMLAADNKTTDADGWTVSEDDETWPTDFDPIITDFMGKNPPALKEVSSLTLTVTTDADGGYDINVVDDNNNVYNPDEGSLSWSN
jgi:type IV pilus assembly protein PilA